MKNNIYTFIFCFAITLLSCKEKNSDSHDTAYSQEPIIEHNDINRLEPPNWWIGFRNSELQLLVHHPNISNSSPKIKYQGVTIREVHKADSPNYIFIDLDINKTAKSGKFNITFTFENGEEKIQTYELKTRKKPAEDYIGFNSSDAIYLITPDRFANADESNDSVEGLKEQGIDRNDDYARHGGDIKGITEHLDYIASMGFTAIWPCPLLTNDMPRASYHGYAMTDFYEIDPRFGTLQDYLNLSKRANDMGIKLIMDQVANHCGSGHWWMKDLPFNNWINYQKEFENGEKPVITSHVRTTNQDLYASKKDKNLETQGWFVSSMPDLNQNNPFMANYIIQNSIWWIETAGLGGIRQDTYPYSDKYFMSRWAGSIMNEYPNFNIVGEEWSYNPLLIAYWQDGHPNKDGYDSNLKSTMDFAMQANIVTALTNSEAGDYGLERIYEGLANDFAYTNPKDILIFPDNHDMSRIFTQLKGDLENTKMALATILTMPRTPQIYYGTEILMNDFQKPGDHGLLRGDFPGGWNGDKVNAFTGEGLNSDQLEMQSFLKKLLNYRKHSKAIQDGKTLHYVPENGIYLLSRSIDDESVVLILNKNENPTILELERFEELGLNGKTLKNIITDETVYWNNKLNLPNKGVLMLTTKY